MHESPLHVLFICTGNSARSILAEALLARLGSPRFTAASAGSHPKGEVHPMALRVLQELHLSTAGLRSKSWDEFAAADRQALDFVITVCDNAAGEACPTWPGQPMTAHWGLPDPAAVRGDDNAVHRAFTDTAIALRRRIELMIALPIERLDRLSLQHSVRSIANS
jgi:arsenate reductase